MDLTGINNHNEYYTNHYFSSIFEENASSTISSWRIESQNNENIKTPWAKLKSCSGSYQKTNEIISRNLSELKKAEAIIDFSNNILTALSFNNNSKPFIVNSMSQIDIPIYLEIKKTNGAPLLWILLSTNNNDNENILESNSFDANSVLDESLGYNQTNISNENLVSQIFFDTEEPPRWVVLIGSNQICLLDRNKWAEKRFLEFDLDTIYQRQEDSTFQAMSVLLHKESLCPEEGISVLDEFNDESYRHANDVSKDLKYSLRECIELLGNEVLYDMSHRLGRDLDADPVDAGELTIQCLRFMYRMLFLLFIEARPELGYAPIKNQAYFAGYSLESLRDIADSIRDETSSVGDGYYLHETLSKLYDLIYKGYPNNDEELKRLQAEDTLHDVFVIEPLKAHIFDREKTPMLRDSKIRNSVMLKIIDLMSLTRKGTRNTRRGRISYATLGINQLGSVYEALLSYRGFIAEQTLFEVKKADDKFDELDVGYFVPESELDNYKEEERVRYEDSERKGQLRQYQKGTFIYRLAGREREKSASYYTPECLTKCLVKYALKELLKDKSADEILDLKICEPAMGSAAFLNEAINQLSEAYIELKEKELGQNISYDKRWEEIQKVKMYIADNNVYGVDLNPTAVELAEVSLWLNTIYPGGYVPWFNTQLVNGNSLIGARKECYSRHQIIDGIAKASRWYNYAPQRVSIGEKRQPKTQIYHFLLGDPGMCDYNDKVIKELEKDNINIIKNWRNNFCNTYSDENIETLLRLSSTIDMLFDEQVKLRKEIEEKTADYLPIFGKEDNREISHTTIREKDEIYKKIYKSEKMENAGPYARLKFAMDYWCSLWFWPIDKADMLPDRDTFLTEMSLILEGGVVSVTKQNNGQLTLFSTGIKKLAEDMLKQFDSVGEINLDALCEKIPRLKLVREIANQNKFMHWELEFADIFAERGGFDLILGNPPWVKIEWHESGILSESEPICAIKKLTSPEMNLKRNDILQNTKAKEAYFNEYEIINGSKSFYNAIQNYCILRGLQPDLYKCFIPLAFSLTNTNGVSAYIHPDSIYNDPFGGNLREEMYPRLKYRFHFINELKLFNDIKDYITFCLNIYSNRLSNSFDMLSNLFTPKTIDDSYEHSGNGLVYGIKDENNNWNIKGHRDRIIKVTNKELMLFSNVFNKQCNYKQTKLPVLHSVQYLRVLECINKQNIKINDISNDIYISEMLHETNAQKSGIINRNIHFPESAYDMIYSGPHIFVANPLFKTSRRDCKLNSDYDCISLKNISNLYFQRCNYVPNNLFEEYIPAQPITTWGEKYISSYRLCARKMLNLSGERTLISTIIPPQTAHINGIIGFCFKDVKMLLTNASAWASLPYDFLTKITGKANLNFDCISGYPIINNKYMPNIIFRFLKLNCITEYYKDLVNSCRFDNNTILGWSKSDMRLPDFNANNLNNWSFNYSLKNSYARRQAFIEIDVLVSMALGISLQQLKDMYRLQFPVLQQYEGDTWYDGNGNIIFTNNQSLTKVGLQRETWEKVKNYKEGQIVSQTITDDTMPGGPVERIITYVAPFDKCDREKDYETAWKFFEEKYKEGK